MRLLAQTVLGLAHRFETCAKQAIIIVMERTSVSLLNRLQQQAAPEDWARLVELYKPFIERFIRLDSALSADAEDICQEVLKRLVQHLPRFRRERDGSFRIWLKTITVNEVNGYWRRRLRRQGVYADAGSLLLSSLQDPRNELSQRWDREHNTHVLRRLQEQIEPDFAPMTWQAFRLRVYDEKSTDEAAAILGISKNAVDIAKSRVLARLRKETAGLVED
jgi:RNA polymerase sigma-70 factor (ECF subfamily)